MLRLVYRLNIGVEYMFQQRVVQQFKNLTETEQYICQQLIELQKEVKRCGIVELANQCHTSSATLFRTIQTLGYDGYSAFKQEFFDVQHNVNVSDLEQKGIEHTWSALHQTERVLNSLSRATLPVIEKQTIYICGSGVIQNQAGKELERQLKGSRYNIERISDEYEWKKVQQHIKRGDIAVLISLSGENKLLLKRATELKVANVYTIGVCHDGMNQLGKMVDLFIPYTMPRKTESVIPLYMALEYITYLLINNRKA